MIEQGDSELDLVLRDIFPYAAPKVSRVRAGAPMSRPRLPALPPRAEAAPGPREILESEPEAYVPEYIRRYIEGTMFHAQPPSHQAPIRPAKQIDLYPTTAVALAGGAYGGGAQTTIVTYTVPEGWDAVITYAGQAAESAAAYQDIQWRIRIDSKAHENYSNIRTQLFQMAPPGTTIYVPVRGGQTVDFQGASLSVTTYNVWARLMGWMWPSKFTEGESALGNTVG